ncbi:iron/zinc transporter protein-like protein [Leishmania braziliensis MHOM/BR/75/M2904]|uniref:Iron/zinc transporter protein-like protein n=2 Tax=Leishmania braziliensis TaxID=5660 RepID=A4HJU6_LEIBR|nr:iron/zinc transporter protein-like protein [Leishmania braziliensis MHOM/BR/75/M2904]CAM42765.1 iron/zinc transporter protein-like protein [Leishmania braziliensis MHOM/BR/75/M2904]
MRPNVSPAAVERDGKEHSVKDSSTPPKMLSRLKETSLNSRLHDAVGYRSILGNTNTQASFLKASSSHHYSRDHSDEAAAHGHQHLSVAPPPDMGSITRVISAVCMEFGVTLHSVFVGLTVGLTTDSELKPLIVALVFHQLFEGMAMGSRLADAKFRTILDIVLALVFATSAPAGMAAAAIAVSVSPAAMSGSGFVTLVAVLDTLCGGILLYLAFTLLLGDFVADVRHYCADGQRYRIAKKITLFVALWVGMGLMALVGNWL